MLRFFKFLIYILAFIVRELANLFFYLLHLSLIRSILYIAKNNYENNKIASTIFIIISLASMVINAIGFLVLNFIL